MKKSESHLTSYAVITASIVIILAGIHALKVILAPIFMATFFAVLLFPYLRWLRKKQLSEVTSLITIMAVVLICGGIVTSIMASQLTRFYFQIPEYRDRFSNQLLNYNINLQDYFPTLWRDKDQEPEAGETPVSTEGVESLRQRGVTYPQPGSGSAADYHPENTSNNTVPVTTIATTVEKEKETVVQPVAWQQTQTAGEPGTSGNREVAAALKDGKAPAAKTAKEPENEQTDPDSDDANTPADGVKNISPPTNEPMPRGFWDEQPLGPEGHPDLVPDPNEPLQPGEETGPEDNEHRPLLAGNWSRASEDAMKASSKELFRFIAGLTGELSILASSSFVIMLLVIFMLLEASSLPQKIASLHKEHLTNEHIRKVAEDIHHYMVIKTFVSLLVGFFVTILLIVTNVQYPLMWGFVAFLLNYIPNIGSVVAAIPPIILATVDHGLLLGGVEVVFFVLINCSIGYILEPKLLGDGLDLSPLVVLISLLFCGWLLGPVGMFLSPPLAVIAKIILASFEETKWIATLMAKTVPKVPDPDVADSTVPN